MLSGPAMTVFVYGRISGEPVIQRSNRDPNLVRKNTRLQADFAVSIRANFPRPVFWTPARLFTAWGPLERGVPRLTTPLQQWR